MSNHEQVLREREREKGQKLREYQHQRVRDRLNQQLPPIIIVEQSPSQQQQQQQQQESSHQVIFQFPKIYDCHLRSIYKTLFENPKKAGTQRKAEQFH